MQKTENTKAKASDLVEKMSEAGVQYGYAKSRRHPSAVKHIFITKNGTDIINLENTEEMLNKASMFLADMAKAGKNMLLVGTKPEARGAILAMAEKTEMPYVSLRWIGGTLTNFTEIKKRIIELETLTKEKAEGSWSKYTKKEASDLAKKMKKLEAYYGGMLNMKKLPDLVFIIDPKSEITALLEAKDAGIPVVSLAGTDNDISTHNHPILGNDSSVKSIKFFTELLSGVWQEAFVKKA